MSHPPLPAIPGPAMQRAPMPLQRQPLIGFLGCSMLMHVSAALTTVAMSGVYAMMATMVPFCQRDEPFEVLEVSMVSLPKSDSNVPDREARAPVAAGVEPPLPVPEPPPVKESDLVIPDPEPPPDPGNIEEARRQKIIEDARKKLLEENENAPVGPQDRMATDPDGQENLDLAVLGVAASGDPEVARWVGKVQSVLKPNFQPLAVPAGTTCKVNIWVDPETGRIKNHKILEPSGILGFDAAAERAVDATGSLPLAPEKYRVLFAKEGVAVRFTPP